MQNSQFYPLKRVTRATGVIVVWFMIAIMSLPSVAVAQQPQAAIQAQPASPMPVICSPDISQGVVRAIPAGCTVGGDVEVGPTENGPWTQLFTGAETTGTVLQMAVDGFVYGTNSAGLSNRDRYDAAGKMLTNGCGFPQGGCAFVNVYLWTANGLLKETFGDNNMPPSYCNGVLSPGMPCVVPAGYTVGGNVNVYSGGNIVSLFDGVNGRGNTTYFAVSGIIDSPSGAGMTSQLPLQAALGSLINGCGNPAPIGCDSQNLWRFDGAATQVVTLSDGQVASTCSPDLFDGEIRVMPADCTIGGKVDTLDSWLTWMSLWDPASDVSFTLRTTSQVVVRSHGPAGVSQREPIGAARESLSNGCGSACRAADVVWFGPWANRQTRLPDDPRPYQVYLPGVSR